MAATVTTSKAIEHIQLAIQALQADPDSSSSSSSIHLRWHIYQLLQAQAGDDGLGALYKELRCSIHLGLMGENGPPYTLPCGHSFCYDCLVSLFASVTNCSCPDCRKPMSRHCLTELHPNIAIKAIVERLLPKK
jgi:hypothetical protein